MLELSIVSSVYDVYKATVDIVSHTEKRYRYSLGISLENNVLSALDNILMAKQAPQPMKAPYLLRASSQLDAARLKLRLILELKLANETKIFQAQAKLAEAGKQLGGWLKSTSSA